MSSLVALTVDCDSSRNHPRDGFPHQQTLEAFAAVTSVSDDEEPAFKRRRVSDFAEDFNTVSPDLTSSMTASRSRSVESLLMNGQLKHKTSMKKPQMKYEPETPMSKDELAAWRREQRRVRNRQSAALSRQRQRDAIASLEVEVGQWKIKVNDVMKRIKQLEEASGIDSRALVPTKAPELADLDLAGLAADVATANTSFSSKFVSPPVSPGPAETSPSSIISTVDAVVDQVLGGVFEQEHSDKMISRHAVS